LNFDRKIPYIILTFVALWAVLSGTGLLQRWLEPLGGHVSPALLAALVASALIIIPIDAFVLQSPRMSLVSAIVFLAGISVLPILFDTHPVLTLFLLATLCIEAITVPRMRRRLRGGQKSL
jgi:hypothetical protein